MVDVPRRSILKGALFGPVIWSIGPLGKEGLPLDDIEGTPVQKIADPNNMTPLEEAHLIKIDCPAEVVATEPFNLTVSLPNHPMAKNHHIAWLRVYLDRDLVTFVTLAPVWQKPEVTFTFTFDKGHRIDVVADCNQHGLWGMPFPIVIKPLMDLGSTGV